MKAEEKTENRPRGKEPQGVLWEASEAWGGGKGRGRPWGATGWQGGWHLLPGLLFRKKGFQVRGWGRERGKGVASGRRGEGGRWEEVAHKQGSREEEQEGETESSGREIKNHILKNANGLHQSSFLTK